MDGKKDKKLLDKIEKAQNNFIKSEILCDYILKNYYIKSIRQDNKEEIWIFDAGIYIPNGRSYIEEQLRTILCEYYKRNIVTMTIDKIKARTYTRAEKFFFNDNKNPFEIPVKNGILNVNTKKIREFDPNVVYFAKLPVNYNKKSKCKKIKEFLYSTLPKSDAKMVVQFVGFCLVKKYIVDKCFLFTGSGSNGKSLILKLFRGFFGIKNCTNLSLGDMHDSSDNFSVVKLHGKLINISGDISSNTIKTTGLFKRLTTGDLISANRKFKTPIEFINTSKMVFCANELPNVNDSSDGFFRRWEIIEFPYKFVPKEEFDYFKSQNLKEEVKVADPKILNDILNNEKEFEGLLNWSLELLDHLMKKRKFCNSKNSIENKKQWIRISNSFSSFFDEYLEIDPSSYEKKSDIKKKYANYCRKHNVRVLSDKSIHITMSNKGVVDSRIQIDNERYYCWDGCKFKSKPENKDIEKLKLQRKIKEKVSIIIGESKRFKIQDLLNQFDSRHHIFIEDKLIKSWVDQGKIYQIKPGLYGVIC